MEYLAIWLIIDNKLLSLVKKHFYTTTSRLFQTIRQHCRKFAVAMIACVW